MPEHVEMKSYADEQGDAGPEKREVMLFSLPRVPENVSGTHSMARDLRCYDLV